MPLDPLTGISSIDGRYREAAKELTEYFSGFVLIRARVRVECEYIIALSETKGAGIRELTATEKKILQKISDISLEDAQVVKKIEREGYEGIPATNHDVKAVEYFVKRKLAGTTLADVPPPRGACPDRVPPRAAGLQAARAGATGGVTPKGLLNFLSPAQGRLMSTPDFLTLLEKWSGSSPP